MIQNNEEKRKQQAKDNAGQREARVAEQNK